MKIIHFADLHLGVENYGRTDPATGLSSRLGDFLKALDELVDYALENKADIVIFCGDAYKTREPSQTQQRELAKRINRLAAEVPVFLLIGNHDLPNATGRATTTEIFDTLAIENVYVAGRPGTSVIPTKSGEIQVVALPWLRRSALLGQEDAKGLSLEEIKQKQEQVLTGIVADNAEKLDPALPAVLAAHVWVTDAKVGSESMMTIGQEHALLLSNIARPEFDYVALGHIHKRQVLRKEQPPVVYSGSLERVDFGEEKEEKGFYVVDIGPGATPAERSVSYDFHPVGARRFLTIEAAVGPEDLDPTATILAAVNAQAEKLPQAVVRLNISLPAELEGQLRDAEINAALKEAHHATVTRDIKREERTARLGSGNAEEISPLAALKAYLDSKEIPPERAQLLLEYGEKLIESTE